MKRYSVPAHGYRRFGVSFPHRLNRCSSYRGGIRL
ncbi:hypothetical protein [Dipodfec virus RodF1_43]|uniref:Uncharacterized protein n=1 Tax=Dipodfec virus RodF1_43 TaxID=2929297 RepID=A0A976R8E3_9VIRU|nr:hypothetical protein [Dipodfec virus RodF1_43]